MSGTRAIDERLDRLLIAVRAAEHGQQTALVQQAAREMGVSVVTAYARLRARGYSSGRKLRVDRGDVGCSMADLHTISAACNARPRLNGKIITRPAEVIAMLRENNEITTQLSVASLIRLLRIHKLDSASLAVPRPHSSMRSRHPNHMWQVDSSVCVLFYLGERVKVMDEKKYNAKKPDELEKLKKQRVLRYVATDHASGSIFARYFLASGETAETMFEFLMAAFTLSPDKVMHGVPFLLGLDKAGANIGHMLKSFTDQLGVSIIPHEAGNARANGQVENAQNIIEVKFEGFLAFKRTTSLEELNANLSTWLKVFNNTHIHSRHQHNRSAVWQQIAQDELRICPSRERCQQLMLSRPIERKVQGDLHIEFQRRFWLVSHVPDVRVGEMVDVSINPYTEDQVFIKVVRDGKPQWHAAHPSATDKLGFYVDAAVWGESYNTPKDTPADIDRKRNDQLGWGTSDRQQRQAAMTKGAAFGGRIDPMKHLTRQAAESPQFITRRGTAMPAPDAVFEQPRTITFYEFARALRAALGRDLEPSENAHIRAQNREWTLADVQLMAAEFQQPKTERPRLVAVK